MTDDRLLIRDAFVGWPGCSHDARVFRNSRVFAAMEDGQLLAPNRYIIGLFIALNLSLP